MNYIIRCWGVIIFFLCVAAISSALIAEYIFNILPCPMCLNQRYPYYFIISIFIIFYFAKKMPNIWFYILTELAVLYGLFYSVWHVGIEQNFLTGPSTCSGKLEKVNSAIDLKYISACCYQAKVSDIKFLRNNKIFLIYLERYNIESNEKKIKIISVIKCEYVSAVKSKNINQKDPDLILELITIDVFKKKK